MRARSKTGRTQTEPRPRDGAPKPRAPLFRLDEPAPRARRPLHRAGPLSLDATLAPPERKTAPHAHMLSTRRLLRRMDAIGHAIRHHETYVRKLARRLARNDRPRLRKINLRKRVNPVSVTLFEIDDALGLHPTRRFQPAVPNTS